MASPKISCPDCKKPMDCRIKRCPECRKMFFEAKHSDKQSQSKKRRMMFRDALPFKIEGIYCKLIALTQGQFAIVNLEDYERLSDRNWHAMYCPNTRSYYAGGYFSDDGINFHHISMHREILNLRYSRENLPDHINHVTLDNRRNNLREATYSQNCQNRKRRIDNISGFKGVFADGNKWRSEVELMGERVSRSGFNSPLEAHLWYQETAKRRFGEFARFE